MERFQAAHGLLAMIVFDSSELGRLAEPALMAHLESVRGMADQELGKSAAFDWGR